MPKSVHNKRVGVLSQRLSNEASPGLDVSDDILIRFLKTSEAGTPTTRRTREFNPLYRELKNTLQGTIHLEKIERRLMEKYKDTNSSTSGQSTLTSISSGRSAVTPDHEQTVSGSTMDVEDRMWCLRHSEELPSRGRSSLELPPAALRRQSRIKRVPSTLLPRISGIEDAPTRLEDERGVGFKLKEGLEGLEGAWKLKWDEPVRLLDLCRLMDLDSRELERREHFVSLEIRIVEHLFCVKSEIFGLYNLEVPVKGEVSRLPRIDRHNGIMTALIEIKRMGLRMIYTWDHPDAATRRDNYEVSANGQKLIVTAYLQKRDGQYCKVKWQFERKTDII